MSHLVFTLPLVVSMAFAACKSTNRANTSDVKKAGSIYGSTPQSCDDATTSFISKGIKPFIVCTTTDYSPGMVFKFAKKTDASGEFPYLEEACFRKSPDERDSVFVQLGWVPKDNPNAHLAHYDVNIVIDENKFEVTDGNLFYDGTDIVSKGVFYKITAGPVDGSYRYGRVFFGQDRKNSFKVTCGVLDASVQ